MTDTILAGDTAGADDTQDATTGDAKAEAGATTQTAAEAAGGAQAGADAAKAAESDDWRATAAGEDAKLLKFLGKYTDPKAAFADLKKKNDALLQRAGSKLPDNPTDEEIAEYRKQQGIPDKPEGYLETLPKGLVVGDDDKPAVDAFAQAMHKANAPKGAVDAALAAYYEIAETQAAAEFERAEAARTDGIVALKEEWGSEYPRNINAVKALLGTIPAEVSLALAGGKDDAGNPIPGAVDAQGIPLASNPHVIRWLASISLEQNPLNTVVPGAGANQASAVADEIAEIEKFMRTNQGEYFKDEKKQERLRTLYAARDKIR